MWYNIPTEIDFGLLTAQEVTMIRKGYSQIYCNFILLGTLLTVTLLFPGCFKSPKPEPIIVDDLKPYEVSWYFVGNEQTDVDTVNTAINTYLETKLPNTTLKMYHYTFGTWFGTVPPMVASQQPFDILYTSEWLKYWDWYELNALKPLDALVDTYAPNTKNDLGEERLKGAKINGKLYALPVKSDYAMGTAFLFNKNYLDKYGFDLGNIINFEDIEPWLETVKANETEIVPFHPYAEGFIPHCRYIFPAGDMVPGALTQDDATSGQFFNQYEKPRFMELAKKTYQWTQAGYISSESDQTVYYQMIDGKVFCYSDSAYTPFKEIEQSNDKVTWEKKVLYSPYISTSYTSRALHGVSVTSKNPIRAVKLLELANTDEALCNLITYGVEGKHYSKIGTKMISRIQNSGYAPFVWETCNRYLQYFMEGENESKWDNFDNFASTAISLPTLGFWYDRSVKDMEISDIQNIGSQYKNALLKGSLNPEVAIPELLQAVKGVGGDQVLADLQVQYDTWKSMRTR